MLHVRPLPGKDGGLEGGAGAYVWVFVLAAGEAEFQERAAAAMEELGLFIAETQDLDIYGPHDDHSDETNECLEQLSETWPVQCCSFHTYPADES